MVHCLNRFSVSSKKIIALPLECLDIPEHGLNKELTRSIKTYAVFRLIHD